MSLKTQRRLPCRPGKIFLSPAWMLLIGDGVAMTGRNMFLSTVPNADRRKWHDLGTRNREIVSTVSNRKKQGRPLPRRPSVYGYREPGASRKANLNVTLFIFLFHFSFTFIPVCFPNTVFPSLQYILEVVKRHSNYKKNTPSDDLGMSLRCLTQTFVEKMFSKTSACCQTVCWMKTLLVRFYAAYTNVFICFSHPHTHMATTANGCGNRQKYL